MLEINNLKAVINKKEILKGLNLKINPGVRLWSHPDTPIF